MSNGKTINSAVEETHTRVNLDIKEKTTVAALLNIITQFNARIAAVCIGTGEQGELYTDESGTSLQFKPTNKPTERRLIEAVIPPKYKLTEEGLAEYHRLNDRAVAERAKNRTYGGSSETNALIETEPKEKFAKALKTFIENSMITTSKIRGTGFFKISYNGKRETEPRPALDKLVLLAEKAGYNIAKRRLTLDGTIGDFSCINEPSLNPTLTQLFYARSTECGNAFLNTMNQGGNRSTHIFFIDTPGQEGLIVLSIRNP